MTKFKPILLAAALALPGAFVAGHATAQVGGVAVVDAEAAIGNTRAARAASTQIQATYKTQLDQANARSTAAQNELRPLLTAYQTAARAPGATEASLRPQAQSIQTKEQAAKADIARLTQPAQLASAYAAEQIQRQLPTAVQNVVKAKNISLLVSPQAVQFAAPTVDVTTAVTAELDRLVPSVSTTPPAGWQPGQQGAAGAAAATTAPATTKKPSGR